VIRILTTGLSRVAFLATFAMAAVGCATAPTAGEDERLDTTTGTTVTVMPKPVELIVDKARGGKTDPFAYLAPFETNRMGSHELFLWVSAPQVAGALGEPQVFCGESQIPLEKFEGSMRDIGLSGSPYKTPAPWSVQWYFRLSGEVLDCLSGAQRVRLITHPAGEESPDIYVADGPALSALSAFTAKVRT
jgi:hypothetical protein